MTLPQFVHFGVVGCTDFMKTKLYIRTMDENGVITDLEGVPLVRSTATPCPYFNESDFLPLLG